MARKNLMIIGGSIFAGTFGISALAGGTFLSEDETDGAPLLIPIAGPFVSIATLDIDMSDEDERSIGLLLIINGVAQATGVTLFIVGAAAEKRVLVRDKYAEAPDSMTFDLSVGATGATGRLTF
ncbi:MAG: hypothetical protein JRH11_25900 [Deltaproteobacteria bacterium]|nr:hypothetical protein [Deltaproteobacteria bacterium]